MKRLIYITILSILLPLGCSKPSPAPAPAPEQYDRYIFFSHGVETKASLIESAADLDGKAFGVVGFKYDFDKTWETEKATATPNVFADTPETVDVSADGTTAEYAPLQGWSNNKKYAFFAFYPHDLELVNLDADTPYSGGVPAVKYSMNPADLKASMVDVMTASPMTDLYWKSASDYNIPDSDNSAGGEVNFAFSHRLSCLGLKVTNASAGDITLTSVTFNLSGIKYHQALIPLDGAAMSKTAAASETASLSVEKSSEEVWTIPVEAEPIELHDKLIFIPQDELASINVKVEYKREAVDGYEGYSSEFTTNELRSEFLEGKKHIVGIKFTDSGVQVTAPKAGAWVEIPPVNSSFK